MNLNRNEESASEIRETIKTTYSSEPTSRTGNSILILNSNLNDGLVCDLFVSLKMKLNVTPMLEFVSKDEKEYEKLCEIGNGIWDESLIWFEI